ncbi:MAG: tRNA (adenosine(37)-N6)-dimethylallyltransferase MiaA [Pseudomonadota bacterium]
MPHIPTPAEKPVLIAGPTASGKSALSLDIAEREGRPVVNADALQVYSCWRVLTARPDREEEQSAPHHLYGHVPCSAAYSVGDWLRDVAPLIQQKPAPIFVGGTGLYFRALTQGLADIPTIPEAVRAASETLLKEAGIGALMEGLDRETRARIDTANPRRVQRAWEVQEATGRGLAAWHDATPAPLLPLEATTALVIDAGKDWLAGRITRRFDQMLEQGALDEAQSAAPDWNPARPSSQAIGAAELVAHVRGEMSLEAAREAAITATLQYAKRQRTWFRARMGNWTPVVRP